MGFPILVRWHLCIESGPRTPSEVAMALGFWLTRIQNRCDFNFIPWFIESIFYGNYSCFYIPAYPMGFTRYSLYWNVLFNCIVSCQSLCIQATTTVLPCDQLFNDTRTSLGHQTNFESYKMGLNKRRSNWTIVWAGYDRHLLTYIFISMWYDDLL